MSETVDRKFYDVHEIARYLNMTPRRVQQLVIRGVLPKGTKRGEYDLIPCIHSYQDHLKRIINRFTGAYSHHCRGGRSGTIVETKERDKIVRRIYSMPGKHISEVSPGINSDCRQPTLFDQSSSQFASNFEKGSHGNPS